MMADQGPTRRTVRESTVNWGGVIVGGVLLALIVVAVQSPLLRVVAAITAFVMTIYISQRREERQVESPLLSQIQQPRPGLDRRKYGRLRKSTQLLLAQVREMNRIAVDARSGKISQRHAHAELDRVADKMRNLVDVVRKAAGIPTPVADRRPGPGGAPRPRPVPRGTVPRRPGAGPSPTPREPRTTQAPGSGA